MVKYWIKSLRLRTLPLAAGAVLLGSYIAYGKSSFQPSVFWLTLLTALLLQIISNLANDYGDYLKGTDSHRSDRMVSSGHIAPSQIRNVIIILAIITLITGLYLLYQAFSGVMEVRFIFFLVLGILAIIAALAYTLGKKPYGYIGLGDLFVFIFFGITAVFGTYFLQAKHFSAYLLLPAIGYGCLCIGVLNINNTRDLETDKSNKKYTIPVLLGRNNAKIYQVILVFIAFFTLAAYLLIQYRNLLSLLALSGFILLGVNLARFIRTDNKKADLFNPLLKQFAIGSFLTVVFFIIFLEVFTYFTA